jgi:hypothetical protein
MGVKPFVPIELRGRGPLLRSPSGVKRAWPGTAA